MCRGLFPPLLCALRENKTVRGMGPKADNIYIIGTGPLHFFLVTIIQNKEKNEWKVSKNDKKGTRNVGSKKDKKKTTKAKWTLHRG